MKITQDVREYARTHGLSDEQALTAGMEEKAKEFEAAGAEVYRQA
jgi:phosphomethylpyrimidine synthase